MKKIVCLLVIGLILIGSISGKEKENLVKNNVSENSYEQMKNTINTQNQNILNRKIEIQSNHNYKDKKKLIVNGEERRNIRQYVDSENSRKEKKGQIEESNKIKLDEEKLKSTNEELISNESNQSSIKKKRESKKDSDEHIDIAPSEKIEPLESSTKQNKKQKPNTVGINGLYYSFKNLKINTNSAQTYIDKNPNSFGLWKNVVYSGKKMNIMFGHDYGSGKLVKSAKVGDTLILSDENGNFVQYSVVSKVVVGVEDYYSNDTKLWQTVGKNFDLMIKTCEKRNVTDLVITLQRIRE